MAIVSEFDVDAEFDALTEHKPWPQVMAELIRKYPLGDAVQKSSRCRRFVPPRSL